MLFGWPNRVDGATISGGSWTGLDNIKDRDSYRLARSTATTTAATKFSIDLTTTDYSIKAVSLHHHNLKSNALWRVTVGTTNGGSELYDSGFVSVWSVMFDLDINQFEEGAYWPELIDNNNASSHFSIINTFGNTPLSARYITIEINDVGNTDGFVEIGRIGVWSGFSPAVNAAWGAQYSWDDLSDVSFSNSGEFNYRKRRSKRTANLSFKWATDSEAATFYEFMRRVGLTGETMFIPDPADLAHSQRYGFRAKLRKLGALEKTSLDVNTVEIQAEELL